MSQDDIKYILLAECNRRAATAGLGDRAAARAMRDGFLTVFRIGRRYHVAESEFRRWLAEPGKVVVPSRNITSHGRPALRRIV